MRRFMGSAMAGGLIGLLTATTAAAFPAETVEITVLLQGPAEEFDPIAELPPGTEVEVLNCDAEWCEVSVADFDGFLPRQSLDLRNNTPPRYLFPPLISQPSRWHGRYYSREHYRYESRARWRDREGRRLFMVPPGALTPARPLRPLTPQFQQKQFQQKGPPPPPQKQFQQKGPGQPKGPPPPPPPSKEKSKQFQQKGPGQPKGPPPPPPPPSKEKSKQFQQKGPTQGPPPQQQFQQKQVSPPKAPPPPPPQKDPPPKKKDEKKGNF